MTSVSPSRDEQHIIDALTANWIWVPNWVDSCPSSVNTAGRIVRFSREFNLETSPTRALLYFSADTRYKLYINGTRVAVGPCRGSPLIWFYDTLDIAPYLRPGNNEIVFVVLRYFAANRAAMPFERTLYPGLTAFGRVELGQQSIDLSSTCEGWQAQVDDSILYPTHLIDDGFLHISERIADTKLKSSVVPIAYALKTLNGDLAPWRLRARCIPLPEESQCVVTTIRSCQSSIPESQWAALLMGATTITLPPAEFTHIIDLQADVHSTAFLQWSFKAVRSSQLRLKATYSEGYELKPRSYPFFRTKDDRLDAANGYLIGPFDEVTFDIPAGETIVYEPFWFRTFRLIRLEINVSGSVVEMNSFSAIQVNYPLGVKASWKEPWDPDSSLIWDVSIRTLRNCMFDGYSDCPFYEQLQYIGDSRTVGLFHYLLSGDDSLMRLAITTFGASTTPEGLPQSRFPSHVPQVIAGFCLYWILQVCDHHLFYGDTLFSRRFLPRIDGILDFFEAHVDDLGLVSGLPQDVWQYVDWVTTWGATNTHPDKGVPTAGRMSNRHTYFSLLYSYVLQQAAKLLVQVGRPAHADEYNARADSLNTAVRKHCFDGRFFTDSTANLESGEAYSQHCQVFAVLCGAAPGSTAARLLTDSFIDPSFSKCSYMMKFYSLRAFAMAGSYEGSDVYDSYYKTVWDPWRKMLRQNLTTWEEDDVRQRSDCHAWGSVPIFEYCVEVAGLWPLEPGWRKLIWKPRMGLTGVLNANVVLGRMGVASVRWKRDGNVMRAELLLEKPLEVISRLPEGEEVEHGTVDRVELEWIY